VTGQAAALGLGAVKDPRAVLFSFAERLDVSLLVPIGCQSHTIDESLVTFVGLEQVVVANSDHSHDLAFEAVGWGVGIISIEVIREFLLHSSENWVLGSWRT